MTYFLTSPRQSGSGPLLGSVGLWRDRYGNGERASDGNFLMGSNGKLLASIWGTEQDFTHKHHFYQHET